MQPLIISPTVLDAYSRSDLKTLHDKNLFALGEDRYLTTLMLRSFPRFKLKYTREATCLTVAPETWSGLLSQRRRWINSTIHNLYELMSLKGLCGFCCFSMRFVVLVDLFGTLIMPASVIYLAYLIHQAIAQQAAPIISLLLLLSVYGIQSLVFLVQMQWQYLVWLLLHILAIPLMNFVIPLYAYWHFDDFSWDDRSQADAKVVALHNTEPMTMYPVPSFDMGMDLQAASRGIILDIFSTCNLAQVSRRQLRQLLAQRLGLNEAVHRDALNAVIDVELNNYM